MGSVDRVQDEGGVSTTVDEPSLLAQDVQPGVLILQNPQDGLYCDAIDSGAWGPIRAAPEHLRGVLRDFRDRVLDGVR